MIARAAIAGLLVSACASARFTVGGDVAADGRVFVQSPKYSGQGQGSNVSLVAEPSAQLELGEGTHKFRLDPFYRLDPADERRSHFDIREASYRLTTEHFGLMVGATTLTWGVLEGHRPADVINQHDFVESISDNAKLGQPMVEVGWVGETMSLKGYVLPYFRDETFPGVRGRLRFPVAIDVDHPQFESALGRWQPGGALRYTLNKGDFDLGISAFTGTSREPRFILELTTGEVVPRYDQMHQGSVDLQYTVGALTLKAEGYVRLWTNQLRVFGGGGAGLDYTFFAFAGEADLSLAVEFFYDSRPIDAPVTFFDHDAFAGIRLAINDTANTEATVGAVVDVIDGSTIGKLEVSRRFFEHWRAYLSGNLFLGNAGTLQASFMRDSYVQARVAYFF